MDEYLRSVKLALQCNSRLHSPYASSMDEDLVLSALRRAIREVNRARD